MAKTCTIIVPAFAKANADEMLAAFWGDPAGSPEFSVPLSADGNLPITHYALSLDQSQENAAKLLALRDNSGTLPATNAAGQSYDLTGYNVTEVDAAAAAGALATVSASDSATGTAVDFLNAQLAVLGLVRYVDNTDPHGG